MMTTDIDMPGRPQQDWYAKDAGKLGDLATAAFEILGRCVRLSSSLISGTGWKNVGMSKLDQRSRPG